MSVLLETSYGDVVIDLFDHVAPRACLNFIKLCKIKYYNDCEFFRVEKGFVAQTGDPKNDGSGGVSVFEKCQPQGASFISPEISLHLSHSRRGTVSMTTSAADADAAKAHGSQFFITLADDLTYLDGVHTIIGRVEEGLSVLDKLAETEVNDNFKPYRVIRIRHTIILHDPYEDPPGFPQDCPSPEPLQTVPEDRLASDEELDDDANDEERARRLKELQAEREARSRAEVLEMIGDIGDADMKPPENVLFICKLNPVTEADDLEIIFSRFGECKADVLHDSETGDSLCYGFVEFESKEHCERAYFKMDSAVIDDRRVLVDFSQSVSRLWNATRRRRRSMAHNTMYTQRQPPLLAQAPKQFGSLGPNQAREADKQTVIQDDREKSPVQHIAKKRRRLRSRFENAT
ncbi:Peptidyl-prolyl cis-trans isomerase CYP59 [Gracilariopsis chorda]|uniref:Peptidyl-prolyl cis-trans isomerase n=1 Tax=Gracilariopsis chorda TaxID=448386 RepID=A0A2V3IU84_9FLOR|nr:Peptidyl-prolyl cis-trans isomerase CYP59 [Gracilariopsis chorda]|eukprot:PXF44680.1 Peptidyl-prolyl cis-trans isomerase CYP59 [Gracilariopsis chorda]